LRVRAVILSTDLFQTTLKRVSYTEMVPGFVHVDSLLVD